MAPMPLLIPVEMQPVWPLFMTLANVVAAAVVYELSIDDGNMDDVVPSDDVMPAPNDVMPPANDVGPVVRGCSNSAKIRLSCTFAQ